MTRPPLFPRRRKARHEAACPRCGCLVLPGQRIFKWPDEQWWRCAACASARARAETARDREAAAWAAANEDRL